MNENLTLREVQEKCRKHKGCESCELHLVGYPDCCGLMIESSKSPLCWDLEKTPRNLFQEIRNALDDLEAQTKQGTSLNDLAKQAYETAICRGKAPATFKQGLLDITEEILEASEAQDIYYLAPKDSKPEGRMAELADVLIATLTLMYHEERFNEGDIEKYVLEKMEYNKTRED